MINFPESGPASFEALKSFIESKVGQNKVPDQSLILMFGAMEDNGFILKNQDFDAIGIGQAFIAPHKFSETFGASAPIREEGFKFGAHEATIELYPIEDDIYSFSSKLNLPYDQTTRKITFGSSGYSDIYGETGVYGVNFEIKYTYAANDLLIDRGKLYEYSAAWDKRNATINTPSVENIDALDLSKYSENINIIRRIGRTINPTRDQDSESGIFYQLATPTEINYYILKWEEFSLYNRDEPNRVRVGFSPFGGEIFDSAEKDSNTSTIDYEDYIEPYIYKINFGIIVLNPEEAAKIFITISQTGKSTPAAWFDMTIKEAVLPDSQHNVMAEVEVDLYNTPEIYYDVGGNSYHIPENSYTPMINSSINEDNFWLGPRGSLDNVYEFIKISDQNKRIIAAQGRINQVGLDNFTQRHTVSLEFLESLNKTYGIEFDDKRFFHSGFSNNLFYTNIRRNLPSDLEGYDSKESTVIYCELKPHQLLNFLGEFSYTGNGSLPVRVSRKNPNRGGENIMKMIRAKLTRLSQINVFGSANLYTGNENFWNWLYNETQSSNLPTQYFKLKTPDLEEDYPAENFEEVFLEHFNENLMIPSNGNHRESWIVVHFLFWVDRVLALLLTNSELDSIFQLPINYNQKSWLQDTLTPRFSPEKLFNLQTSFFTNINDEPQEYIDKAIEYVNSVILEKKDFSLRFVPYEKSQAGGTLAAARPDFYQEIGKLIDIETEDFFNLADYFYNQRGYIEKTNLIIHPSTYHETYIDVEVLTGSQKDVYSAEFICEIGTCEKGTLYRIDNYMNIWDHFLGVQRVFIHILETTENNEKRAIASFDAVRGSSGQDGVAFFVAETTSTHYLKFQSVNIEAPEEYFVEDMNFAQSFGSSTTNSPWETSEKWSIFLYNASFSGDEYAPLYYTFNVKDAGVDPYRNSHGLIHGFKYRARISVKIERGELEFGTADSAGNGISIGEGRGIRITNDTPPDSISTSGFKRYQFEFVADRNRPSIGVVADGLTSCEISLITVKFERAGALLVNGIPSESFFGDMVSPQLSPKINVALMSSKRIRCDKRISAESITDYFLDNNIVYNNGYLEKGEKILLKDSIHTVSEVEEEVQFANYFGYASTTGFTYVSCEEEVQRFLQNENVRLLKLYPIEKETNTLNPVVDGVGNITFGLSITKLKGNSFPGVPCGTIFLDQIDLNSKSSSHEINDGKNAIFYVIVHEILHALGISSFMASKQGFVTEKYPSSCTIDLINQTYKNIVTQKINELGLDLNDFYTDSLPMQSGGAHVAEFAKINNGKIQAALKNDLMSPLYDFDRAIITPVTLSLLEGYLGYDIDYTMADGINLLELNIDTSISSDPGSDLYDDIRTCSCCFHDEKIKINNNAKINNSIDIK